MPQFTDAELRKSIAAGLSTQELAEQFGVSRQAIDYRVKKLQDRTVAALFVPGEGPAYLRRQQSLFDHLAVQLERVRKLSDATDLWLTDPQNPERYNLDPRAREIKVQYQDGFDRKGNPVLKVSNLQDLLDRIGERFPVQAWEASIQDPRSTHLAASRECRTILAQFGEWIRWIGDSQRIDTFMDAILTECSKVAPEVAEKVRAVVHRHAVACQRLPETVVEQRALPPADE